MISTLAPIARLLPEDLDLRRNVIAIYAVLTALNVGAWVWALVLFRDQPALLGIALVVYGLGLRHAVDADHIAAIDNVTRKLLQDRQRPVTVGFWFAIGHSAVVMTVTASVIATAGNLQSLALPATCRALLAFARLAGRSAPASQRSSCSSSRR